MWGRTLLTTVLSHRLTVCWSPEHWEHTMKGLSQRTVRVVSSVISSHAYVGCSKHGREHCSLESNQPQVSGSHWSSFCHGFCRQIQCKPWILVRLQRFLHIPFPQRSPTRTLSGVYDPNHATTSGTWRNWRIISLHLRLPVVFLVPFSWWSEDLENCR